MTLSWWLCHKIGSVTFTFTKTKCHSWHQPTRIVEEMLESGNRLTSSWIPPQFYILYTWSLMNWTCSSVKGIIVPCSNSPRYTPSRSFRSSSSITISAPLRKTSMATSKSFSFTASRVWTAHPCFLCLDIACFQKASQAPFFPWCLPWFLCTNHQNWKYPPNSFQPSAYD